MVIILSKLGEDGNAEEIIFNIFGGSIGSMRIHLSRLQHIPRLAILVVVAKHLV